MLYSITIHKFALMVERASSSSPSLRPLSGEAFKLMLCLKHLNSFTEFRNLGLAAKYLN